jgi:hypothetical protein
MASAVQIWLVITASKLLAEGVTGTEPQPHFNAKDPPSHSLHLQFLNLFLLAGHWLHTRTSRRYILLAAVHILNAVHSTLTA